MTVTRRQFLQSALIGSSAIVTSASGQPGTLPTPLPVFPTQPISCNSYTWDTFYRRAGKIWMNDPVASLTDFVQSGFTAYEPGLNSVKQLQELAPRLSQFKLSMPSIYVNSSLHRQAEATGSMASVLAIADEARRLGTRLLVTNPNPIKWGSPDNKSDAELDEQVRNLDWLGGELRKRGLTLAYHTHAPEHRAAAREFHHMMVASNPANVSLCLDVHWVYRGSGNSQVALFDVVRLYGKRIVALHVRQSNAGIWSETFTPTGDIDYPRLWSTLKSLAVKPLIVLEQCLETGSPNTMDAVSAHRQDLVTAKALFT
ncbi:sugar phosphate isomerase/epimerase family protein [Fibrella arboris]|uniref:sugar phosphate isomerase/epimerase family protein n=1 Tax=Fibrella arboris TaxID=3242486 RepID=UPI00352032E2